METSVGIEHPGGLIGLQIAFGPEVSFERQGFLITPPASPSVPGSQWLVDISPDVIEVRAASRRRERSRKRVERRRHRDHENLIAAFIEAPEGASAADIDPATVTLSLDGTVLAEAEPISSIEGGLLRVLFRLDEEDMSAMLGVEVDRIEIDRDDNEIEVRTLDRPEHAGDLIRLTVSGELVDGGRFSAGDTLRARSRRHHFGS